MSSDGSGRVVQIRMTPVYRHGDPDPMTPIIASLHYDQAKEGDWLFRCSESAIFKRYFQDKHTGRPIAQLKQAASKQDQRGCCSHLVPDGPAKRRYKSLVVLPSKY
jgi:hypothetical protein